MIAQRRTHYARLMVSLGLASAVLLVGASGVAWATPGQSPVGQTVPTATAGRPDQQPDNDEDLNRQVQAPRQPLPEGAITQVVQPGTSLIVSTVDGTLNVRIDAGDLLEGGTLTISPITTAPAPNTGFRLFGLQYDIKLFDANGNLVENPTFASPIEVCFSPSSADMAAMDEETMAVEFYDDERQSWVKIQTRVDPVTNQVCGSTGHLTVFALLAVPQEQNDALPAQEASMAGGMPSDEPGTGVLQSMLADMRSIDLPNPWFMGAALLVCLAAIAWLRPGPRRRRW